MKAIKNKHGILDLFCTRHSTVSFSNAKIEEEILAKLLEAACAAPSARNEQPWRFIVAEADCGKEFKEMLAALAEPNRRWAKDASALVLIAAKRDFAANGAENLFAEHDCGMALQNLLLQAEESGLVTHVMAAFSRDAVRELYGIPEDFEPITITAVGFPGKREDLPEDLQEREARPRERTEAEELVFRGKWGNRFF